MNPLFFGRSEKPLFGVYNPPQTTSSVRHGVVLCGPFGHEYMRSHRAFRQLALLLSRQGLPVLRFDYFGTGDSSGEACEVSISQWRQDISAAIEELKDMAAVAAVSLVGLRLGAALAMMTGSERHDIKTVVLWDPIVSGHAYVNDLLAVSEQGDDNGLTDVVGVIGTPLTPEMRQEIAAIDLLKTGCPASRDIVVVVGRERPDYHELCCSLEEKRTQLTYKHIPAPDNWNEVDDFGSLLLPQQIVRTIVDHFS